MKRLYFTVAILALTCHTHGQVAQWLIEPAYDNIQPAVNANIIIADSANSKVLWSEEGKRIAKTSDQLFSFSEGKAVTTVHETSIITGFYDVSGKFFPLSNCYTTYSRPFFYDGHLLVQEGFDFKFVNPDGQSNNEIYLQAFPFSNGYASCKAFKNPQKRTGPYNSLITKEGETIVFSYDGKSFDADDIDFISSVNDENIGIVVAKRRVYIFNGKDKSLSPVFGRKEEQDLKKQAKTENGSTGILSNESDSTYIMSAKCGKNEWISILFDIFHTPLSIKYLDREIAYNRKEIAKPKYTSSIRVKEENNKYGIYWNEKEVLPPQFDEITTCIDDKAFIRQGQKHGVVKVYKDDNFKISFNKGNPIDFRHHKYETTLRLDLPKMISSYHTRIEVAPNSGCNIDMTSNEKKDTEFGNYNQYKCVLTIPESLPDEMYGDSRNDITYPIQIFYDGLNSAIIQHKVKAWHFKYIYVDVNESETTIKNGALQFSFDVNASRMPGEAAYPYRVEIQPDTLNFNLEKVSEVRYKCNVYNLQEGKNTVEIRVLEDGCPPVSFSFDIDYAKPSKRPTNNKTVSKEKVVIKKTKPTPKPSLDI